MVRLLTGVISFGYILAAVAMCIERKLLNMQYPTNAILRHSFHLKLFCIVAEILLVFISGVAMYEQAWRVSVISEWIIGLFFTFYMWSFAIDFFATPDLSNSDDKKVLLGKRWDEEVGIIAPEKARSRTVHKPYSLLR